jgi:Sensors of blue-light using FAD
MFSLVYVSSAVKPFTPLELMQLLTISRTNNEAAAVTGMLLYKSGNFMQVLEGEEEAVRQIHERIVRDPRHSGLLTLLQQGQAARDFPAWSMAFRDLNSPDLRAVPGYSDLLNLDLRDPYFTQPSNAQKLVLTFKQSMT